MTYYLYITAFFLDLAITLTTHQFTISFMRVLFYTTQFTHEPAAHTIFAGFLLMTESFIVHGTGELDLVIIIPLTIIMSYVNKKLVINRLLIVFAVLLCVLVHYMVVDRWLFLKHVSLVGLLTNFALYGIVTYVILCFSVRGNQDNRLMG